MGSFLLWTCVIFCVWNLQLSCGYIEMVEEFGCQDNEFRLTCRHLDSHIAILEATFYPDDPSGNVSCGIQNNATSTSLLALANATSTIVPVIVGMNWEDEGGNSQSNDVEDDEYGISSSSSKQNKNIRLSLNKRCSGLNHCNFILVADTPGADSWGPGLVAFKYACVSARRLLKFCNKDVVINDEGFVQTPGYPKFYVGIPECRWRITAAAGQRVQIMLLDVSLRGIGPFESTCPDRVSVLEAGRPLLTTCREQPTITTLISSGPTIEVLVTSKSKTLFPKRGVLFYYKALGCPTPSAPEDGYLSWRNETSAEFMCCVGFLFPDTRQRQKKITCLRRNTWSTTVPNCVRDMQIYPDATDTWEINSTTSLKNQSNRKTASIMFGETNTLYDVVIPTTVIVALFLVNAIVVIVIYKYRKRKLLMNQEEEMAVIFAEEPTTIS